MSKRISRAIFSLEGLIGKSRTRVLDFGTTYLAIVLSHTKNT